MPTERPPAGHPADRASHPSNTGCLPLNYIQYSCSNPGVNESDREGLQGMALLCEPPEPGGDRVARAEFERQLGSARKGQAAEEREARGRLRAAMH